MKEATLQRIDSLFVTAAKHSEHIDTWDLWRENVEAIHREMYCFKLTPEEIKEMRELREKISKRTEKFREFKMQSSKDATFRNYLTELEITFRKILVNRDLIGEGDKNE